MNDIRIIPDKSGNVTFAVEGSSEDTGLMLLQRLYILLFSDPSAAYRDSGGGLLRWLEGSNIPSIGAFNSLLAVSVGAALNGLDQEDRNQIDSFTAEFDGEIIQCVLKLIDGTTITGTLNNG